MKNKLFRGALRLAIAVFVLCVIAQRSPAPIVEPADNPTPPPTQQSSIQKWKRPAKPRSETANTTSKQSSQKPASTGPARFAGNWSGSISQGLFGTIKVSFSINPSGTSVRVSGIEKPATINGDTITWRAGWFNEVTWTLTPQRDGSIALVTSKSDLGVNGTATFSRGQNETASAPLSKPPAPSPNLPLARPVPGQPGFVYNPFDPDPKAVFDVRSFAHGSTMRDPASGKLFVVP